MSTDNVMSSNYRHMMQFTATIVTLGIAWGVISTKVDALEQDEKKLEKTIETLTNDVNQQAVTMAGIVVTTKNIEKQMARQERLLESISKALVGIPTQK